MAIKTFTTRYSHLTSGNINNKTNQFLTGDYILSPINSVVADYARVAVEDFSLALNGLLIYIESADITYDPSALSEPWYLTVKCEHNFNTPFTTLQDFDSSSGAITAYGAAHNVRSSPGQIEGSASIAYDKNASGADAGIKLASIYDISPYNGAEIRIFIPSGKSSLINSVSLILDESSGLIKYSRYDTTLNLIDGWNAIRGNFSNPTLEIGSPEYSIVKNVYIFITTSDPSEIITGIKVDKFSGIREDPNSKIYDDEIDVFITDNTSEIGFLLGTYSSGWSFEEDVFIQTSSNSIANHMIDDVHIPSGMKAIINLTNPSALDTLITINDTTGTQTDYSASNESVLKSVVQTIAEPAKEAVPFLDEIYLKAENLRRHLYTESPTGANGYIDDSSSTATLGHGYYVGSSIDTLVITNIILSIGGEIGEITVDAPHLKDTSTSDITYDIYINDILVGDDFDLNTTYDMSSVYDDSGLLGTDLRLEFTIPGFSGGDYWTTKTNHLLSTKGSRIIPVSNRSALYLINASLERYLLASDSWVTIGGPSHTHNYDEPHPASRLDGLRILGTTVDEGEHYSLSKNTWFAITNGFASDGRPVDIGNNEFYNIQATITTKYIDIANTSISTTGVSDSWSKGAAFRGYSNKMYVHGGISVSSPPCTNLIRSFNFTNESWSNGATSATDQSYQGYAQLNTKKLHSICGTSTLVDYLNTNNEYDEDTEAWSVRQANSVAIKAPAAGTTKEDTILITNGELSTGVNTNQTFEYTADLFVKLFGFAVKIQYANLYGTAYHVGYWTLDSAPDFLNATQDEKDVSGFWSQDNGKIAGVQATYWDYYARWTGVGHPDYASSTFDQRWQGGYWGDANGKIGADDGPKWG